MRAPRLRFRLRTLVFIVAILGAALGGWEMWRRRSLCLVHARGHEQAAVHFREVAQTFASSADLSRMEIERVRAEPGYRPNYPSLPVNGRPAPVSDEDVIRYYSECIANANRMRAGVYEKADGHRDLAARYRHVARYPWLPMPRLPNWLAR